MGAQFFPSASSGAKRTNMVKIKTYELIACSSEDLNKQLSELRTELQQLRVAQVTGGAASKLSKIRDIRKAVARCLTVMSQTSRAKLKEVHANSRWVPKDLRTKGTRKFRRRLTLAQSTKKTLRASKKAINQKSKLYVLPCSSSI